MKYRILPERGRIGNHRQVAAAEVAIAVDRATDLEAAIEKEFHRFIPKDAFAIVVPEGVIQSGSSGDISDHLIQDRTFAVELHELDSGRKVSTLRVYPEGTW